MENSADRDAKMDKLMSIFRECTAPRHSETVTTKTTVFPPDEVSRFFDATPAQVASRVSSITIAAQLVMTGDDLCDSMLKENIYIDLLDTAAWLARKLAHYHDDLDAANRSRAS